MHQKNYGGLVRVVLIGLLCAGLPAAAWAQNTLDWPTGEIWNYELDSSALENRSGQPEIVFTDTVTVKDAAWIRLYFDQVALQKGSLIRITSAHDGEVQELDAETAAMCNLAHYPAPLRHIA